MRCTPKPAMSVLCLVGALAPLAQAQTIDAQASFGGDGESLLRRRVLVIGVDGMRPDAMQNADTPFIDSLIAGGAVSYVCSTEDRTVSGPCWSTILCGVHRDKHGVSDNSFGGSNYDEYPSVFRRLEDSCGIETVSVVNWSPINTYIVGDDADTAVSGLPDIGVAAQAADLIVSGEPDVIFLHFDEVDGAGHTYGFGPDIPGYLAQIEDTDDRIGEVLAGIDERRWSAREDWLIIVCSDHGGTPDGRHGSDIPEHRLTPLVISGRSSAAGSLIEPAPTTADIIATVFGFLEIPVDPAWGFDGQAVGLDMAGSPSRPFRCVAPPPPPTGACCLPDGSCIQTTEGECIAVRGSYNGDDSDCADAACHFYLLLLAEDFDGVELGPNVDEPLDGDQVWTDTGPIGWEVDRTGVPAGGVTEWRGWSFTDPDWWTATAGDQNRSQFTKASGAIAVADPDEWDDLSHDSGTYNSVLGSRLVWLTDILPNSVRMVVDSSWRPEDYQRAACWVTFDGGDPVMLFEWDSQAGDNFKADATNETLTVDIPNPAGASVMLLHFAVLDAGNDWWWAIDNLEVYGRCSCDPRPGGRSDPRDLVAFLELYARGSRHADLAEPFGQLTGADVRAFLAAYAQRCAGSRPDPSTR